MVHLKILDHVADQWGRRRPVIVQGEVRDSAAHVGEGPAKRGDTGYAESCEYRPTRGKDCAVPLTPISSRYCP